jgi:cytochrome P450
VAAAARERFSAYCEGLIAERRKSPGQDLVSKLASGTVGTEPAGDMLVMATLLNLIIGGQSSTRDTASGALLLALQDPARRAEFEAQPDSLAMVNEVLRYLSPAYHTKREATRDIELRGQRIRAGDKVALWIVSGNYDEDQFEDPERFDARREPNRHLAFGIGEHACIGQHLARLELRILFEHVTRRMGHIELAGPVEKLRSNLHNGIRRLPIRFKPRAACAAHAA